MLLDVFLYGIYKGFKEDVSLLGEEIDIFLNGFVRGWLPGVVKFLGEDWIKIEELLFYSYGFLPNDLYLAAIFYWILELDLMVSVSPFFSFILLILISIFNFEVPISF